MGNSQRLIIREMANFSLDMYTTEATQAGEGLRHLDVDKAEHSSL